MIGLVLALTVGFLLGILLMILLVTGREEEKLLDQVEQAESARGVSPVGPDGAGKPAGGKRGEGVSSDEA
mgnify:CR=1 FL=1